MLYEEGTITEEQAEQIIGEKMMARLNSLNSWCKENGFRFCLHSTFRGVEKEIFKTVIKKLIDKDADDNMIAILLNPDLYSLLT